MNPPIGRDTQLCMSLAARPGNFGSRFHNHLYEALGLDYVYKAFTTRDLPAAISGIRALGKRLISGGEVAMLQVLEQFILYTGVTPTEAQAQAATR